MAYQLRHDETVEQGVRRIALERIDHAVAGLTDATGDRDDAVHEARKDCKKIRAVLRLVRGGMPSTWRFEHDWFRDAAATLSHIRDSRVVIETHDKLMQCIDAGEAGGFETLRDGLAARRRRVVDLWGDADQRVQRFLADLRSARQRVQDWTLEAEGFAALRPGLARNYRRAREAMDHAWSHPGVESFHEWRKPVKYYWYHCRLLEGVWPALMAVVRDTADELGDLLGDDHDLAVLGEIVLTDPGSYGGEHAVAAYTGLIEQRRRELQEAARPLGERLLAEKPGRMTTRLGSYWASWLREAAD